MYRGGRLVRKEYINLMVLIEMASSVMEKMYTLNMCD